MKLAKHLVLNKYFLDLFGFKDMDEFREKIKDHEVGFDSKGRSYFMDSIIGLDSLKVGREVLIRYDDEIRGYVDKLRKNRSHPNFNLKYFQYLAVLFTEVFLDKFFNHKDQLLKDLEIFVEEFNSENRTSIKSFDESDLEKLAFWMATGGGKTLIMHVNYWQFFKYCNDKYDNIILITPNEGMSKQHLKEITKSGIKAKLYEGSINDLKTKPGEVLVIDIHKLTEEKKGAGVTIEVSYFDGKNLVFIDEGHKGQKSEEKKWKKLREKIGKQGFIFEYSATFGQVIGKNKDLLEEYSKSIIFDYSYKYFYSDGYGKDFYVYNLKENLYTEKYTDLILTANLLSYYEQLLLYEENKELIKENEIEKPLWVFVGGKVSGKGLDSDVIKIIEFIKKILEDKKELEKGIKKILDGSSGLVDEKGEDIFREKFKQIKKRKPSTKEIYEKIFSGYGNLDLYEIKNADGEIGLKISEKYFGVINVGDISSVKKLLGEIDIEVKDDNFTDSLFFDINENTSPINVLIGSKKFIEGWDSWRVSSMGLLNMGKGEGAQIIQLFGRGVRLKGKDFSLKRDETPNYLLQTLQTLNIFGFNADYINAFLDAIKQEEVEFEEFEIPIKFNRQKEWENNIYTIKTKEDFDFTQHLLDLDLNSQILSNIKIDLRPKITLAHGLQTGAAENISEEPVSIDETYIQMIDWESVFLDIMNYKILKGYYNLIIQKNILKKLIENNGYNIYATEDQISVNDFKDLEKIRRIIISILKNYIDKFYTQAEKQKLMENLVIVPLNKEDDNLNFEKIILKVPKDMISQIDKLLKDLEKFYTQDINDIPTIHFDKHLYAPIIIYKKGKEDLKSAPVKLNKGETKFVVDLRDYLKKNEIPKDKELFLLRNLSKKGVGFFKTAGFYPDFIIWIKENGKQKIVFTDPKGIMNLGNFNDEKIQFCSTYIKDIEKKLKEELKNQKKLKDKIELAAYILSVTEYDVVKDIFQYDKEKPKKEEFEEHNIIFMNDKDYMEKLIEKILN